MFTRVLRAAPPKDPPPKVEFNPLPKIINGGIAGIVGVTVVFPLDLVKTRLQSQKPGPNGELLYTSMFDCFKKTYAAEGYFGMYRGSAVNIILITPEKAIKLTCNDMYRFYLTLPDGSLPLPRQMLAGGMAGACQIVVTTPMELLKIQMQDAGRVAALAKADHRHSLNQILEKSNEINKLLYLAFVDYDKAFDSLTYHAIEGRTVKRVTAMQLTRKLIAERGILGLYKGLGATFARDVGFSIVYFPAFAILNDMGPVEPPATGPPFWWSFLSGCAAGSIAALSVNPLDVIKTRVQSISKDGRQYKGWVDCALSTMKEEGPKAFFKGGACRMMVIAPLFGIAQSLYYIGLAENYLGIK